MKIHAGCKMSKMENRREKNKTTTGPTSVPGTYSFKITNTNNHDGRENYAKYHDIYDMF